MTSTADRMMSHAPKIHKWQSWLQISLLAVAVWVLASCMNPMNSSPTDEPLDNPAVDDDPALTVGPIASQFWGSWVRMDDGAQWYISDRAIVVGSLTLQADSADETSIAAGSYIIGPRSENILTVNPGQSEFYLFRQSGVGALARLHVQGAGGISASSIGGIGGIDVILRNPRNPGNDQSGTTRPDGSVEFDDTIPGDEYEIEIPEQPGISVPITAPASPQFDGDDLGFVTVTNTEQNFKISYRFENNQFLYSGQTYQITIRFTNTGTRDFLSGTYQVSPPPSLTLSGSSLQDILGTVRANNGTRDFSFGFTYNGAIDGDYTDVVIPVNLTSVEGVQWSDEIAVRVYREPMTIHFRSVSNPVKGIVMTPERRSIQFATGNRSGSVSVPRRTDPYILALTGADYNSETKYSFRIDEVPLDDGSSLTDASYQEPNDDEATATPAFLQRDHLGFLGVYDLDFFSITNNIAEGQDFVWTGVYPAPGSTTDDTTPNFSWNGFSGIESYEFRIAESETSLSGATVVSLPSTDYQPATALANNLTHYWQVRGVAGGGSQTAWSPVFSFSIQWGNVGSLSPASGSSVTTPAPTLSWPAVEGAVGYEVQVSDVELSIDSSPIVATTATSTVIEGVPHGTIRYWRVRATNTDGQKTMWSQTYSFNVVWGAITGINPTNLSVIDTTSPTIVWAPVSEATGYEIKFAPSSTDLSTVSASSTSSNSYLPTSALENNATYYFSIRAIDEYGNFGDWTDASNFTVSWGDIDQQSLSATQTASTTPTLSWTAVPDAVAYEVQYTDTDSIDSGSTIETHASVWSPDTSLQNLTTYRWRVRAVDANGKYSAWTASSEFTVSWGQIESSSPADSAMSRDASITVSWSAVVGAAHYQVRHSTTDPSLVNANQLQLAETTTTVDTGLTEDGNLYWHVQAIDGEGQAGSWSSISSVSFRTYKVGDAGEAGIVFYDKGVHSNGWRYLEVLESDLPRDTSHSPFAGHGRDWAFSTSAEIGTGYENTNHFLSYYDPDSERGYVASRVARLSVDNYDDWFIPSLDELKLVFENRQSLGDFVDENTSGYAAQTRYYTSTERNAEAVESVDFSTGATAGLSKFNSVYSVGRLRPIRRF